MEFGGEHFSDVRSGDAAAVVERRLLLADGGRIGAGRPLPLTELAMTTYSTQTLGAYGNVKQHRRQTEDGNYRLTTYNYLHETGPNAGEYLSRYAQNRLTAVTVQGDAKTWTPFTAAYDGPVPEQNNLPAGLLLHDSAYGTALRWQPVADPVWTVYGYDEFGRTKTVTHAPAAGTVPATTNRRSCEIARCRLVTPQMSADHR
jgi:hypothetical protein